MRPRLSLPRRLWAPLAALACLASCHRGVASVYVEPAPGERHLANIRQLTFGGENAEAYFSADGQWLTYQSTREGRACDQQYVMRIDGSNVRRISNGLGKTTCGYFYDADRRIFFSSTHDAAPDCPPRPDYSQGYVW